MNRNPRAWPQFNSSPAFRSTSFLFHFLFANSPQSPEQDNSPPNQQQHGENPDRPQQRRLRARIHKYRPRSDTKRRHGIRASQKRAGHERADGVCSQRRENITVQQERKTRRQPTRWTRLAEDHIKFTRGHSQLVWEAIVCGLPSASSGCRLQAITKTVTKPPAASSRITLTQRAGLRLVVVFFVADTFSRLLV